MRWQEIPVYINNRDNLERGFKDLLEWLVIELGMEQITIIDN